MHPYAAGHHGSYYAAGPPGYHGPPGPYPAGPLLHPYAAGHPGAIYDPRSTSVAANPFGSHLQGGASDPSAIVINALLYNVDMQASNERLKEIELREQASRDREKEMRNRLSLTHNFVDQTRQSSIPAPPQMYGYAPSGPPYY